MPVTPTRTCIVELLLEDGEYTVFPEDIAAPLPLDGVNIALDAPVAAQQAALTQTLEALHAAATPQTQATAKALAVQMLLLRGLRDIHTTATALPHVPVPVRTYVHPTVHAALEEVAAACAQNDATERVQALSNAALALSMGLSRLLRICQDALQQASPLGTPDPDAPAPDAPPSAAPASAETAPVTAAAPATASAESTSESAAPPPTAPATAL